MDVHLRPPSEERTTAIVHFSPAWPGRQVICLHAMAAGRADIDRGDAAHDAAASLVAATG